MLDKLYDAHDANVSRRRNVAHATGLPSAARAGFALAVLCAASLAEPTVPELLGAPLPDLAVAPSIGFGVVEGAIAALERDPLLGVDLVPSLAWLSAPPIDDSEDEAIDSEGYYRTLYRRFTLSAGAAAYTKFNTNMQVSGSSGVGANLDMEDLLDLNQESTVARVDARYAFNRTHWVEASFYDINRDGERVISDPIMVGDVVIPAGPVTSHFDTTIIKLAYRYNFVTDKRTVIGASFGFHVMALDTAIRSPSFDVEEEFKVNAPLPLLGLHGGYALGEKWRLTAAAEFLQFDLGEYRGLVTDMRLTLDHDTFEHFGWGLGFNGFSVDARFEDDDLTADLEYGYQGLMLYLRLLF